MMIKYCQTCKGISIYDIMGSMSECSDSNENKLNILISTICHWNDHRDSE